jgi:hypothetical protein
VWADRYVLNFDLNRLAHHLPAHADLSWSVLGRKVQSVIVLHPRTKGGWTPADLEGLRDTLSALIGSALTVAAHGGTTTLVGSEHISQAVFPLADIKWFPKGFNYPRAAVDNGKLATAMSVQAVLTAAERPQAVRFASAEDMAKERGRQWQLETRDDYFLGDEP